MKKYGKKRKKRMDQMAENFVGFFLSSLQLFDPESGG
jgi:hypothetical protein